MMKPSYHCITRLLLVAAIALATAGIGLLGCRREKVVEPLKKPEDVKAAMEKEKRKKQASPTSTRRAAVRTSRDRRIPPPATTADVPGPDVSPSPTPIPTPIDMSPIIIEADKMWTDRGVPDPRGGRKLARNGFFQIDNVHIPYPVAEVTLEMKGTPAGNVWPEVDLNMYNRTEKKNFFPWPRDYVTTSGFHLFQKAVKPPLPPGTYLVTFRYYNDDGGTVPNEDRAVTLRRIILRP